MLRKSRCWIYLLVFCIIMMTGIMAAPGSAAADGAWVGDWTTIGSGTPTVTGDMPIGDPSGIAVDSSGNVYVADKFNCDILKKSYGSEVWTTIPNDPFEIGTGCRPWAVAVDPSGNVYVVNSERWNSGIVWKYNGATWTDITHNEIFDKPSGIAVDSSYNVYVTDTYNGRVMKLPNGSNTWQTIGDNTPQNGNFGFPVGITVDNSSNLYVTDYRDETCSTYGYLRFLERGSTTWGSKYFSGQSLLQPSSVAVDKFNNIYVANTKAKEIYVNLSGRDYWAYIDNAFNSPYGIAVDSYGNVYVTDQKGIWDNKIYKHQAWATQLVWTTQPGGAQSGNNLYPQPTVELKDGNGITISAGNSDFITAALTDPKGSTLSGTSTIQLSNGVTAYQDLNVNNAGTYTLTATGSIGSKNVTYFGANESGVTNFYALPPAQMTRQSSSFTIAAPPKAATPTASPVSGTTVANNTSVTLSTVTVGATIYYTTNGSDPTTSSPSGTSVVITGAPEATVTVKAMAAGPGWSNSDIATFTYYLQRQAAAVPTASPPAGTYNGPQNVELKTDTTGASIYYTTDGTDPTTSSTQYTGAIEVTTDMIIKAIAVKEGMENSPVATFEYIIVAFAGGDGSVDNPYQVATPEQLDSLRKCLDKHFIQTVDIDLSSYNADGGWVPIGNSGSSFRGTFNGDDKTISNLTINRSTENYVGLFGVTSAGAKIQNVKLENNNVNGQKRTGALVGENWGTITNSYATGAVTGTGTYVGGLVGFNGKAISGSYTTGTVNGQQCTGGLVGDNCYGTITLSYSASTVTGKGGVAGLSGSNSYGTITNSYARGAATGTADHIGGLVGWNYGGTITNAYATGAVVGINDVGGLVGKEGTVTKSYWDKDTSGTDSSAGGEGVAGKTTAEMQLQETYVDWDFTDNWNIDGSRNNGYPFLTGNPLVAPDADAVAVAMDALTWEIIKGGNITPDNVTTDLTNPLPTTGTNGTSISWSADPANWIDTTTGEVTRPGSGQQNIEVTLTATITKGSATSTKTFTLAIKAEPASEPTVADINAPTAITAGSTLSLTAPTVTDNGATITAQGWQICAEDTFTCPTPYSNETLATSHNGWYLRYFATNSYGTTYSNTVQMTVTTAESAEHDILTFALPQQTGPATIDNTAHTVNIQVEKGTDPSNLTPTITVSPGATINPLSGVLRDFSAPVIYTVTAEDSTIQEWTVTVTVAEEAATGPWDGTIASSFAGGSGTADDPYQIATGSQLAYLAQVINDTATNAEYRNKHYKLMTNLDLGGHEWTPIGPDITYNFGDSGGSFDGNGYTISNLQIGSLSSPNSVYTNAGLFGWTTRATLKNIALENVAVYSSCSNGSVGGLTGVSGMHTNISNCYVTGILQSAGSAVYVGGLTGKALNGASIKNSFATAGVLGGMQCCLGGLAGQIANTINNCYATGDVAGGDLSKVGGLVGNNPGNIAITNGYWNSSAVQMVKSAPQTPKKGVGSGADNTTSMSSEEMQAGAFVLTLNVEALKDSALKQWLLIAGRNDNYPLLGGVGAGLVVGENAEAPVITADPVDKTVSINGEASLSVTAVVNSGILSYQWYSNTYDSDTDGTLISGATDSTYKAPTGVVGTIYYYCVVTNTDNRATKVQTATTTSTTAAVTVIANEAPTATNVAVSGTVRVGQILTGSYIYTDVEGDQQGTSIFKWYRANDASGAGEEAIPGATGITYVLTDSDLGKYICFEVTPVATGGATPGTAQKSPYTTQVLAAGLGYRTDPGNFSPITPPLSGSTYTIRNAAELAWLAVNVNKGTNFYGKSFVLANDIDLSAHFWVPIGSSNTNAFYATFDGNGKTISGLTIGTMGSGSQLEYTGLFGVANLATIKNVILAGVSINSSSSLANTCTGALAARASNTSIINCQAAGNITTTGTPVKSGGLVGWLQSSAVKDSHSAGSVTGGDRSYSGGLVGHMYNASLSDCYVTGSVTVGSSNCSAGGLTGFAESTNSITNCYAAGNVVAGDSARSGGLVGWGQSQITNCYATGDVTGGIRVGGLIGYSNSSSIINAYATGNLSGTDGNAAIGSLVGFGSAAISDGYGVTNPSFPVNTEEMKSGAFVAILSSNASSLNNSELAPWLSVSNTNNNYPLLNGIGDGANRSDAEAPSITSHPRDISVGQGNYASLSVSAGGTGTLSYQWFRNNTDSNHHGVLIPGATGSTYTVPTSALGTTYYYCAVINTKTTSGVHTVATEMSEVARVEVVVPTSAAINPTTASFDKNLVNQADVSTTIIWNNATSATDVKKAGTSIGIEAYTVTGDTLTVKKEYLANQEIGDLALSVEFDKGDAATLTIAISDTTLSNAIITSITAVSNVEVAYGAAEAAAIAALAATTTITDSNNITHTVNLSWSIASYDGDTAGNYTATGTFALPAGVDQSDPETELRITATVTVNAELSTDKTLVSITAPSAITGIANGTAKEAAALGLPAKVTLVTNDGNVQADVSWDVAACAYDPSVTTEQTFTVSGNVTLPSGVVNPNNVDLTASISVTVNATVPAPTYTLTITAATGGSITTGSSDNYTAGTVIAITATPASGYSFNKWTSTGGGTFANANNASTTYTMPANASTITASFTYQSSSGGGGGSSTTTSGTQVTSSGGTISIDGATFTFPAGAVENDIRVQVKEAGLTAGMTLPDGSQLLSRIMDIIKDKSGNFLKPVTINLSFNKSGFNPG